MKSKAVCVVGSIAIAPIVMSGVFVVVVLILEAVNWQPPHLHIPNWIFLLIWIPCVINVWRITARWLFKRCHESVNP